MPGKINTYFNLVIKLLIILILYRLLTFSYDNSPKVGVYGYLQTPSDTKTKTADVFYPIIGSFVNYPLEDFVFASADTAIRYIGVAPKQFLIIVNVSLSSSKANNCVYIGVKKNDILQESAMGSHFRFINRIQPISLVASVYLESNDLIQLVTSSTARNSTLKFHHVTAALIEFFNYNNI